MACRRRRRELRSAWPSMGYWLQLMLASIRRHGGQAQSRKKGSAGPAGGRLTDGRPELAGLEPESPLC